MNGPMSYESARMPNAGTADTPTGRAAAASTAHAAAASTAHAVAGSAARAVPAPVHAAAAESRPWLPVLAAFGFACLLSIAAFPDAWAAMRRVWSDSDTFAHGYIALPCAAWMIWRRRSEWQALPSGVWWPAVVALAGCGLLWLAGRLGGVASLEQFGAVSIIPATVLLLAGPAITRALAFPLAFLYFAVPVGEFLTPIMMEYTADATVAALRWTGVPVYREGLHFMVPTGRWSVVEACSGLRYLIASLALGVLYAYLQFRTLKYRLAFMALAIVVPIIANWIRAYLIVMIGHLSDMQLAAGADHLIYGWLFFGLVMGLLFWIGSRWREPQPAGDAGTASVAPVSGATQPAVRRKRSMRGAVVAAVVAAVATLAWRPVSAALLDATRPVDAVPMLQAALASLAEAPTLDFEARYGQANASVDATRLVDERPVQAQVFYYARQHETREMIHWSHGAVRHGEKGTTIRSQGVEPLPWGSVATYRLARAGSADLLVWHWYAVGSTQTPSGYRAKLATTWSLLTGQGDHSVAVVLATPIEIGATPRADEAMRKAQDRLAKMARTLEPAIVAIARGRAGGAGALAALPTDAPARARPAGAAPAAASTPAR